MSKNHMHPQQVVNNKEKISFKISSRLAETSVFAISNRVARIDTVVISNRIIETIKIMGSILFAKQNMTMDQNLS